MKKKLFAFLLAAAVVTGAVTATTSLPETKAAVVASTGGAILNGPGTGDPPPSL